MATAEKTRKRSTKPRVEIGADEARQSLGDLIDRAGFKGERFVLTRHGKQLVAIIGIDDLETLESGEAA